MSKKIERVWDLLNEGKVSKIKEALNKSVKTGEILDINNPASLGDVMNEIFKVK